MRDQNPGSILQRATQKALLENGLADIGINGAERIIQ